MKRAKIHPLVTDCCLMALEPRCEGLTFTGNGFVFIAFAAPHSNIAFDHTPTLSKEEVKSHF